MGLLGWLARRALAAVLWAPLVGAWFAILSIAFGLPLGRAAPAAAELQQRVAILAIILGSITDWLIVRRVKKAMKAREAPAQQRPR